MLLAGAYTIFTNPVYSARSVKRLLVLGGTAALLAVAGVTDTYSARPPALLTYSVVHGPGGPFEPGSGLCLARPDGSRRVRLTRGDDHSPTWSPDGRFVAFARQARDESVFRIVIADTGGRIVRQFGSATLNTDPAWSPDGRRIAYVAGDRGSRIVVASARGRVLTELPTRGPLASRPAWSPDGRRIAYAERLDTDAGRQEGPSRIVVINADGTGRRLLASNAGDPTWSPDGSKIAYVAYRARWSETGDIAVANADGSDPRRLSSTSEPESRPAWAPDGRLIAFARGSELQSAIVVARSDGSGERGVVRSGSYGAFDPAWRAPVVLPKGRRPSCS